MKWNCICSVLFLNVWVSFLPPDVFLVSPAGCHHWLWREDMSEDVSLLLCCEGQSPNQREPLTGNLPVSNFSFAQSFTHKLMVFPSLLNKFLISFFPPKHSVYCRKHRDASQDGIQGKVCSNMFNGTVWLISDTTVFRVFWSCWPPPPPLPRSLFFVFGGWPPTLC